MNQPHNTLRLSTWARLVILSLLLIGLCLALGVQARPVHATSMNTFSVSNCSNDSQLQADINTANSDNANDTITFACRGRFITQNLPPKDERERAWVNG